MNKTTTLCMTVVHSDKISASDICTNIQAALQADGYTCKITDFSVSGTAVTDDANNKPDTELTDDDFTDVELECIYGIKSNRSITCEDDATDTSVDRRMR